MKKLIVIPVFLIACGFIFGQKKLSSNYFQLNTVQVKDKTNISVLPSATPESVNKQLINKTNKTFPVFSTQPSKKSVLKPVTQKSFSAQGNNQVAVNNKTANNIAPQSNVPPHRTCGTMDVFNSYLQQNPGHEQKIQQIENNIQNFIKNKANNKSAQVVISIPVVVHVVYKTGAQNISDAQIQSQIDVLNEDFRRLNADASTTPPSFLSVAADAEIEFCLASKDELGLSTTGIVRVSTSVTSWSTNNDVKYTSQGGSDAWDRDKYLNIWVCNLGAGLLGYAQFPGFPAATDGVVILYNAFGTTGTVSAPFNKGRTSTHEVGHWLGLRHIWGDDGPIPACSGGSGLCSGSDLVGDTPNQEKEYCDCPSFPQNTCSSDDMFMNYMDYTYDACMNLFTAGQASRMNAYLNTTRSGLKTSDGCEPTGIPFADFTANVTTLVAGGDVSFTDLTSGVPASWAWDFGGGGTPNTSTAKNPVITFNTIGTYTVTLTATNVFGSDDTIKTAYIDVVSLQGCAEVYLSEGFEGGTFPPTGWNLIDQDGDGYNWLQGDSATGMITNSGTGVAYSESWNSGPGPLTPENYLITPAIDLTGVSGSVNLYYYVYEQDQIWPNDHYKVVVSTTGATVPDFTSGTIVFEETMAAYGSYVNRVADLSSFTGNTIYIAFVHYLSTDWYRLNLDDVSVSKQHGNELVLDSISEIFYTLTPNSQAPAITFGGSVSNNGLNPQGNSVLNVDVTGADSFSGSSAPDSLVQGTTTNFTVSPTYTPPWKGIYNVDFNVTQDSTDCVPGNNSMFDSFEISDTVYARDNNVVQWQTTACYYFGGACIADYELANRYEIINTDTAVSMSIRLGPATSAGTIIEGKIYDDAGGPGSVVASTGLYTVQPGDTFPADYITIPFASNVLLSPGNYWVAIASSADTNLVILSNNVTPENQSMWIFYNSSWYTISGETFFIRLNMQSPLINNDLAINTIDFYSSLPESQISPITYEGRVINNGASTQNNVKLKVNITGSSTFTDSSAAIILTSGTDSLLTIASAFTPSANGSYNLSFTVSQNESEEYPPDNSVSASMVISDSVYARDNGVYTGIWDWNGSDSYEIGNVFEITTSTVAPTSVSVYLHPFTVAGGIIKAFLYNGFLTPVDSSASYTIQPADIGTGFISLPLLNTPTLSPDFYLAVIAQTNFGDTVVATFGSDIDQPTGLGTSWFRDTAGTGSWSSYISLTAFVRLNIAEVCPTLTVSPSSFMCEGDTATINAGGYPFYTWTPSATLNTDTGATVLAFPPADTTYTVIATDSLGCTDSATVTVSINALPVLSITPPVDTICAGDSTTLIVSGADFYSWSPSTGLDTNSGDTVFALPVITTTYNILGTTTAGCTSEDSVIIIVNIPPPASVSIAESNDTICAGDSVTFTATPVNEGAAPAYQWQINGVNIGPDSTVYTSTTLSDANNVTCILTSSLVCVTNSPDTSNTITMTVFDTVAANISIISSADTICIGDSVTFTATPTNEGASPAYQWQVNGVDAGTDSTIFSTTSLNDGDTVECIMTSSLSCVTGSPDTSNAITTVVNSPVVADVSVSASSDTICAGDNVTFTATPVNGGATPVYQWQVNGLDAGSNSPAYATDSLNDGDTVTCIMTSSLSCVTGSPDTSNDITTVVNTPVVASISIIVLPDVIICDGENATFIALPANEGTTPAYQWQVNGVNIGPDSSVYSSTTLNDGNVVTCILNSSLTCVINSPDTSNNIPITVNSPDIASVTISESANPICIGDSVVFTATPVNEGASPTYQWQVNGVNAGTDSPFFGDTSINDADVVSCIMSSSLSCVTGSPDTSNLITMSVSSNLLVSVNITASSDTICTGDSIVFIATPINGGATPSYQWQVNGGNVGTDSPFFGDTTINNLDTIRCIMTSSLSCATGSPDTSGIIIIASTASVGADVSVTSSVDTICTGDNVTFTAAPVNGGATPAYQWQVNGSNVGTDSTAYSTSALNDGDSVRCIMTSSLSCSMNPDTSNAITTIVNSPVTANVTISESTDTICSGDTVTFTAAPVNSGASPNYQWQINGIVDVGTNSTLYSTSTLNDGNILSCIMTSSFTCVTGSPDTSNLITMTVNPLLPVSIAISESTDSICSGDSVTFTAVPVNGGASPFYQWQVNGSSVGTNSTTYTSDTLSDGDVVTCILTSSSLCITGSPATSNGITMVVFTPAVVSVSISESSNPICSGDSVAFTATPINGGAPTYQWLLNSANVGTNSPIYSSTTINDGDTVECIMISSLSCVTGSTDTSTSIIMNVSSSLIVGVSITTSSDTICAADSAIFTATPVNEGASPTYQWQINGVNVGSNSPAYSSATLNDGNTVTCIITSSLACVTNSSDTSNAITMNVIPFVSASVSITESSNSICSGDTVVFTASPLNEGVSPVYQWQVNGTNSGTNSATFSTTSLNDGDSVNCIMTSSLLCVTGSPSTSNAVVMVVSSLVIPDITISASGDSICPGDSVTFTAVPVNEGVSPVYQWQVNGANSGSNSSTFATTALSDGDDVRCIMISSLSCLTVSADTSNTISISVGTPPTANVSISESADTICTGDTVVFTATPSNGGVSPTYQWQVNSSNAGTNSTTYSTSTLNDGDVVTCIMTSSLACVAGSPAASNAISITVTVQPVSVAISASANPIFIGDTVVFTATPTNGGVTPTYQWQLNGSPAGSNSTTYSTSTLNDGDTVTCIMTSSLTCVTGSPATSNAITMTVNPLSVSDPDLLNNVKIYPNPANDILFIETNNIQLKMITISNSLGQVVIVNNINDINSYELDVSGLSAGIYFLQIQTNKGMIMKNIGINK